MAHEIDIESREDLNGSMAFVGETPWHGLGQKLDPDAPLETWAKNAGLDYNVIESPVYYRKNDAISPTAFPNRKILLRSDNGYPLSIVSGGYRVDPPMMVLDFFRELIDTAGFKMSTAGVLFNGQKIWALAETGNDARIMGQDLIKNYVLFSTGYDGATPRAAQDTVVRVVCNNTLTMAIAEAEEGRTRNYIKIPHSREFDKLEVQAEMGLIGGSWDTFVDATNVLAKRKISDKEAVTWLVRIFGRIADDQDITDELIEKTDAKTVKSVLELYKGKGQGSNLRSADGTAWGLVNAVTEQVDHHRRTKIIDNRLDDAWFGDGNKLKQRVFDEIFRLAA